MRRVPSFQTANARRMRNAPTPAERKLWRILSSYRPRFTRQLPVGPFIADIACRKARLIVELDGGQHGESAEADAARTRILQERGWQVIRFWNPEVLGNPDGVALAIEAAISARTGMRPEATPSRAGRERNGRHG